MSRWFYIGWVGDGTKTRDYHSFQIQLTLWSRQTWPHAPWGRP